MLFKKVIIVQKAKFESRVIVNCETNINSYYKIYFKINFKKKLSKSN